MDADRDTKGADLLKQDIEVFLDHYLPVTPSKSGSKVVHDGLWGTIQEAGKENGIIKGA